MRTACWVVFMVIGWSQLLACDYCSCGAGGATLGVLPHAHRHAVGVRMRLAHATYEGYDATDQFYQAEIWGRWVPHKRLTINAQLPYRVNLRDAWQREDRLQGWSDPSILAQYSIFRTPDSVRKLRRHHLMIGGGVTLPLGEFNLLADAHLPAQFRLGAGSLSYMASVQYQLRILNRGLAVQASWRRMTMNTDRYRFGDQWVSMFYAYYWMEPAPAWRIMPYAGMQAEGMGTDFHIFQTLPETGGWSIMGIVGSQIFWNKWLIQMQADIPAIQQFGEGVIRLRPRLSISVGKLFG